MLYVFVDPLAMEDRRIINYMLSDRVGPSTLAGLNGKGIPIWLKFLRVNRKWSVESLLRHDVVCLQRLSDTDSHRIDLFIFSCMFIK